MDKTEKMLEIINQDFINFIKNVDKKHQELLTKIDETNNEIIEKIDKIIDVLKNN